MNSRLILALDQSTSATKAILFDARARRIGRSTVEHGQIYPRPGWVEHDAEEIFRNALTAISQVFDATRAEPDRVTALAITNQRETVVVWDKGTGRPVYNAVVWQCRRGADICRAFRRQGHQQAVQDSTGLLLDPYFSASKIKWILDNVEGGRGAADSGKLLCGTIDSWLIWKLTRGGVHATDPSNACRTMLFDIHTMGWNEEIAALFGIPVGMLPEVRSSDAVYGHTTANGLFPGPVPITGVTGDSQGALFGQRCLGRGMAKATYGTGSSVVINIGDRALAPAGGLVTSVAWSLGGAVDYVYEGNVHCTGDTIEWLAKGLGLIPDSGSSERIALSVEDNNGVYLVPAFVGLGAPHWDSDARASITGMARNTTRGHIVRAALESIGYQIKDLIDVMTARSGITLSELRVDGGASRNGFLMQFQADLLDVPIVRSEIEEVSALGSTYIAGLTVGLWSGPREIEALPRESKTFRCRMPAPHRDRIYQGWKRAVKRTLYQPSL